MTDPFKEQLTKNFALGEFFVRPNPSDPFRPIVAEDYRRAYLALPESEKAAIKTKLTQLSNELEKDRARYGKPVIVTSGVRFKDPRFHGKAMAADYIIRNIPHVRIQADNANYPGGLGSYDHHTHKDIRHLYGWSKFARWRGVSR